MKKTLMIVSLLVGLILLMGFMVFKGTGVKAVAVESKPLVENENYTHYVGPEAIVRNKKGLKGLYKLYYDKHIAYTAPNGKPIHIVAHKSISDEQVLRAYNLLAFYLESDNGYDMEAVANKLADSNQKLVMAEGADGQSKTPAFALLGQPLYQAETPTDGGKWFIENDYSHRDAAFEEILHFVHDYGIGTKSSPGALDQVQKAIYAATMNALPKDKSQWGQVGLWGLNSRDWLLELEKEGSLEQEYLASVVDSYYGLWSSFQENEGGMWGIYTSKDRAAIKENDPMGYALVESLLPKYITYMVRLDPSFKGTFKMSLDPDEPYTYKSQYFVKARLTGDVDSNLMGNDQDNILMGNHGNNTLDGQGGYNVVQFQGASGEYDLVFEGQDLLVKSIKGQEGHDRLKNIQVLRFTDKDVLVKDLYR